MFGRRRTQLSDPRAEYGERRLAALTAEAAGSGWRPTPRLPDVWAAVVETGLPWGGSTLVARHDGTAELFTSTGKHWAGGEVGDDDVRAAARGLLLVLQARLAELEPTQDVGPPGAGYVTLRALIPTGQRAATAPERPLTDGIHALSTLHFAAQEVVRQLMLEAERDAST
ncbi:hypothetical protein ACPPVT_11955 [Angustibacter sp. McL0619]|uniref:hypothetical protein n=1 Tax=Angustibacter sp. McL0619 TaxID=3415676 RepID=UPI003CEB9949